MSRGISARVPEKINVKTESIIKILTCFPYMLEFTFVASDIINHIGKVAINIVCISTKNVFIQSISSST